MAELRLPFRDRDQRLDDPGVLELPRALEDREERAVADRLLLAAMADPQLGTVGDLLDRIEGASRDERRRIADEAREAAGFRSFSSIEWDEAQSRRQMAAGPQRDSGRALQICAEPSCRAFPVDHVGAHAPHAARKWWCDQHRHLAAPGDLDDWTPALVMSAGPRGLVNVEELKADRIRRENDLEGRRRRREAVQAERRVEAAAAERHERAVDEWFRRAMPEGLR